MSRGGGSKIVCPCADKINMFYLQIVFAQRRGGGVNFFNALEVSKIETRANCLHFNADRTKIIIESLLKKITIFDFLL